HRLLDVDLDALLREPVAQRLDISSVLENLPTVSSNSTSVLDEGGAVWRVWIAWLIGTHSAAQKVWHR
ncbi:MAG: hypothetical protein AAF823_15945, partial [Planctomycetota bacterium]